MDTERFQNIMLEQMARLTQKITELETNMATKEDIAEIRSQMATKKDIARIENEITPKINALFDGYQLHTEQLKRIEEKVSAHEEFILKRIK